MRGGVSGLVLPLRRSMVRPSRFSVGTNWMTILSVTMRTASWSTTGTSPLSVLAGAVRALAASVADHRRDETGAAGAERPKLAANEGPQLQTLNSMRGIPPAENEFRSMHIVMPRER